MKMISCRDNTLDVDVSPIFKYIGGKRWLSDRLNEELSGKNKLVYSDVFCGGLGAFTSIASMLSREKYEVVELNDINAQVISVYENAINKSEDLLFELDLLHSQFISSIPEFEYIKTLSKKDDKAEIKGLLSDAELYFIGIRSIYNELKFIKPSVRSSALLIMIQMLSFNGIYRENRQGLYNVGFCWDAKNFFNLIEDRILKFSRLKDVFDIRFSSLDFRDFNYSNDNLFYLDPPYTELNKTNSKMCYSAGAFSIDDQMELIDLINGKTFVYSNHFNDDIVERFYGMGDNVKIEIIERGNTISSKASDRGFKIKEILVSGK